MSVDQLSTSRIPSRGELKGTNVDLEVNECLLP